MREQTEFSDVDASGRSAAPVDSLGDLAQHVGEVRRDGYEMLALRRGDSALDVGCGAGEVCVELCGLVGPQSRVAGVDLSESMIAAARRTVAAGGRAIKRRLAAAKAGDITPQDGRDFVAAMEARRRADTFFANAIAYSVVGTRQ